MPTLVVVDEFGVTTIPIWLIFVLSGLPVGEPNAVLKSISEDILYPVPDAVYTVKFSLAVPQATLAADATVVLVSDVLVSQNAFSRALVERGEDGGTQSSLMAQEASDAIKQAIMLDSGNTEYESDWYVKENFTQGTVNFR